MTETETLMRFIAAVPSHLPHVRVFRRNIVNADVERNGRHFRAVAGIKGQADAYALVRGGRHVEIETKAAKGRLLQAQIAWRAAMLEMRIPYLLLRIFDGEHVDDTIERWILSLRELVGPIL